LKADSVYSVYKDKPGLAGLFFLIAARVYWGMADPTCQADWHRR